MRSVLILVAASMVVFLTSCTMDSPSENTWDGNDGKVIPSGFKIIGYFPSWTTVDPGSLMFHRLTHINWAFLAPNSDGSLGAMPNTAGLSTLVSKAHAYGVKVLVSIGGWMNDSPDPAEFKSIGTSHAAAFAQNVLDVINAYSLDGADIDWEFPNSSSKVAYDNLMTALAAKLHPSGKLLSAAVSTSNDAISDTALGALDFVNIMAYDGGWGNPASSGPHSSKALATDSIAYWTTTHAAVHTGVAASKVVLGVPFYGRAWSSWSSTKTYADIIQADGSAGVTANDGSNGSGGSHGFNYNSVPTIQWKTQYVWGNGTSPTAGGMMIWELSQDGKGGNSLLSAIYSTVAVEPTPAPTP